MLRCSVLNPVSYQWLCSCLALAGAWALASRRLSGPAAVALAGGLWLLDPKLAAYATNGMETGVLVFFVILWWHALLDHRPGLAFVLGGAYLTMAARAPWYFPAWQVLAYIAVAGGAAAVLEVWRARPVLRTLAAGALIAAVVGQGVMFVAVSTELREQQRLIEWGLRAPLGRDLARAAAGKKATVFLEPLGYIGYFSGLSMRDTPGLCAPEVIAIRRAGQTGMSEIISTLQPDWAVLRAGDFLGFSATARREFESHYRLWAQYDVRDQVRAVGWFPGRDFALFDAYFLVWRRQPVPETSRP